jgi:poly-beta-1,6-N-acetyl-D-glucosamine synthase
LAEKISNTLRQQGCAMQVIVVTDGSTDGSEQAAAAFRDIMVLHETERRGKTAAINRAVPFAIHDILVFTDANTMLGEGALSYLLNGFSDAAIGAVCGEKRVEGIKRSRHAETVYWKYESLLKKLESRTGSVVGAAGELLAVRKDIFEPLPERIILDDFYLSVQVKQAGKNLLYEPRATATELPPPNLAGEFTRRTRIAAGVWQWMQQIFSIGRFKHDTFFLWQFFSHRLCRWFIAPLCFIILPVTTSMLVLNGTGLFFKIVLGIQGVFSLVAIIGSLPVFQRRGIISFPFYFIFTHVCMLWGYIGYLRGKHTVLWKKITR